MIISNRYKFIGETGCPGTRKRIPIALSLCYFYDMLLYCGRFTYSDEAGQSFFKKLQLGKAQIPIIQCN